MSQGPRSRLGEAEDEEGEECGEEEESEEPEVEASLEDAPETSEALNVALYDQPLVSQAIQTFLKMIEKMNQLMGNLTQAVALRKNSRAPEFKTPSIKAHDSVDGTQAHKLRGFIQSFKLTFHNELENLFSDRTNVLYSTSFLTGRAEKWIEQYLSYISNEDPYHLLNNWQLFENKLFTMFGDPNEVRKAEKEVHDLRMKESGHVSLYISDFRSLILRTGDWGERAYIHFYRRGLESRLLD
ncbi:hypothetical protein O181_081745 [Austropuccinia psidii MF-1]|uniref:Ty3 transposon capsid-like protein domain-containing protein n=1 Tax=Austropuccinia psidii MF-1 TaxID=1389203 RepID=A0A9Q3FQL0_9BASI|nr:hypothetical protein [Austropuccinia psidii MF-1]